VLGRSHPEYSTILPFTQLSGLHSRILLHWVWYVHVYGYMAEDGTWTLLLLTVWQWQAGNRGKD
jgi:hypothetical protein